MRVISLHSLLFLGRFSDALVAGRGQMSLQVLSLEFTGLCTLKKHTVSFPG